MVHSLLDSHLAFLADPNMIGWNRGNIKLQNCTRALFNEDDHQVGNFHDAVEDVKSLKRICNFVAEKLGHSSYGSYLSVTNGETFL